MLDRPSGTQSYRRKRCYLLNLVFYFLAYKPRGRRSYKKQSQFGDSVSFDLRSQHPPITFQSLVEALSVTRLNCSRQYTRRMQTWILFGPLLKLLQVDYNWFTIVSIVLEKVSFFAKIMYLVFNPCFIVTKTLFLFIWPRFGFMLNQMNPCWLNPFKSDYLNLI